MPRHTQRTSPWSAQRVMCSPHDPVRRESSLNGRERWVTAVEGLARAAGRLREKLHPRPRPASATSPPAADAMCCPSHLRQRLAASGGAHGLRGDAASTGRSPDCSVPTRHMTLGEGHGRKLWRPEDGVKPTAVPPPVRAASAWGKKEFVRNTHPV